MGFVASLELGCWNLELVRVAAMPTVANPTEWVCLMETNRATYRFNLSLLRNPPALANMVRYEKPIGLEAEEVARAARDSRSPRRRVLALHASRVPNRSSLYDSS